MNIIDVMIEKSVHTRQSENHVDPQNPINRYPRGCVVRCGAQKLGDLGFKTIAERRRDCGECRKAKPCDGYESARLSIEQFEHTRKPGQTDSGVGWNFGATALGLFILPSGVREGDGRETHGRDKSRPWGGRDK
jgi:hypothetical protein